MQASVTKRMVSSTLWTILGRRNLFRLGRFLSNEARLDTENDMACNGEQLVQACVLEHIHASPDSVVLDVGANVGMWSKRLAGSVHGDGGRVRVFAFEPCPETFETLGSNVKRWGLAEHVHPQQMALSSVEGPLTFYSLGPNMGRNGLHPQFGASPQAVTIAATTMDRWCQAHDVSSLTFVKIDAEGHDLEVLRGATEMLSKQRISMLQFEYNHCWIASRHFLRDAFELLQPYGYRLGKITRLGVEFYSGWDVELETFREANFLAVATNTQTSFPIVTPWNERN